jgi:hypothetical protein
LHTQELLDFSESEVGGCCCLLSKKKRRTGNQEGTIKKMDNTDMKSLKLPLFDGEHKIFQVWWTWFMTYTGMFGFSKALWCKGRETDMR